MRYNIDARTYIYDKEERPSMAASAAICKKECLMVTKKEDTAKRLNRRKYEETHKEERRARSANFQTMLPRRDYEELCAYLKMRNMSKVDFLREAFRLVQAEYSDRLEDVVSNQCTDNREQKIKHVNNLTK